MPAVFWVATITMTLLALTILLKPLAGRQQRVALGVIVFGVPALAAGLYLSLGSPSLASASSAHAAPGAGQATTAAGQPQAASVSSLVDGLAAKLAENPDDGKGWLLLAKSYRHLDRIDEADAAYARAAALGVTDPSFDAAASPAATAQPSGIAVTGIVRLSPAAEAIVQPTDTVFIFARAPGQSGAPAAVLQRPASSFPIEFRLTDSQSMVAGMPLSGLQEVVVTARITRSGGPSEALQGLEARSPVVAVADGKPIELVIE